jgi:hypothetical protein
MEMVTCHCGNNPSFFSFFYDYYSKCITPQLQRGIKFVQNNLDYNISYVQLDSNGNSSSSTTGNSSNTTAGNSSHIVKVDLLFRGSKIVKVSQQARGPQDSFLTEGRPPCPLHKDSPTEVYIS